MGGMGGTRRRNSVSMRCPFSGGLFHDAVRASSKCFMHSANVSPSALSTNLLSTHSPNRSRRIVSLSSRMIFSTLFGSGIITGFLSLDFLYRAPVFLRKREHGYKYVVIENVYVVAVYADVVGGLLLSIQGSYVTIQAALCFAVPDAVFQRFFRVFFGRALRNADALLCPLYCVVRHVAHSSAAFSSASIIQSRYTRALRRSSAPFFSR